MVETRSLVGKKSIQFNSSMYDCLRQTIVLKVSSHQLNDDFSPNNIRKSPCPNMFIASANQIADNAATQAQRAYEGEDDKGLLSYYYPAFSSRWTFSFEGKLANKGATRVLREKINK
jgi:hypothetical protein